MLAGDGEVFCHILILDQGENKTLLDAEKGNHSAWDNKFRQVLWQLQDYQEAKDQPPSETQVVPVEIEELFVASLFPFCLLANH